MSFYGNRPILFFNLPPFAAEHTIIYGNLERYPSSNQGFIHSITSGSLSFNESVTNWGKNYDDAVHLNENRERWRVLDESFADLQARQEEQKRREEYVRMRVWQHHKEAQEAQERKRVARYRQLLREQTRGNPYGWGLRKHRFQPY